MKKGDLTRFTTYDEAYDVVRPYYFVGDDSEFKDCVILATDLNNKNTYARYRKSTIAG